MKTLIFVLMMTFSLSAFSRGVLLRCYKPWTDNLVLETDGGYIYGTTFNLPENYSKVRPAMISNMPECLGWDFPKECSYQIEERSRVELRKIAIFDNVDVLEGNVLVTKGKKDFYYPVHCLRRPL